MIDCAVLPTARIASELKKKTSIAASSAAMNTLTLARLTGVQQLRARHVGLDPPALDQVDLVDVGAEQQERGERCGGDRVALGQSLGRVADGVEAIGDLASALLGAAEFGDAAGVVGDRAERVHGQDVGRRHEHAHRRDRGAEDAADVDAGLGQQVGLVAEPVAGKQRDADRHRGHQRRLEADRGPADDVGGRAGLGRLGDLADGSERAGGVELGDVDEGNARCKADDTRGEEVGPGRQAAHAGRAAGVHHHGCHDGEPDDGQQGRYPISAVEHVHRVLGLLAADEEDRHDRREEPEGADDERKEDPGLWIGPAGRRARSSRPRRPGSSRRCSRRPSIRTGRRRGRRSRRRCRQRGPRPRPRCADRPRECPSRPCRRGPNRRRRPWCRCRRRAGRTARRTRRRSRTRRSGTAPPSRSRPRRACRTA